jgi:hypothetical protein
VPKRDLVLGLQVLLKRGGLQVARGLRDGPTLVSELQQMEVRMTSGRNEQYATRRAGGHDDLVLAVALAAWAAKKVYPDPAHGDGGRGRGGA